MKNIITNCIKFISFFIPKSRYDIFCIPESACKLNCVDIINYTADNLLSFINYLLKNYHGQRLTIYLIYYEKERLENYVNYVDSFKNSNIEVVFVHRNHTIRYYWLLFKAGTILSSDVFFRFLFKIKKQIYFSLNYFTPFKLDRLIVDSRTTVDYVAATSLLASQITSTSSKVPIDNFRILGFPRNDYIINPRFSKKELLEMIEPRTNVNKIITYTPTHKDYEKGISASRNIFGYEGTYDDLVDILKLHHAILVIKLHPAQMKACFTELSLPHIYIYEPNFRYTLYDILPHTDVLITDYTSTYFDYLLAQKPVIFNFFDKNIYEQTRGFSFDPIESVCAGAIVETKDEFLEVVQQILSETIDDTKYSEHRSFVNNLMNKYSDCSSERVLNFLIKEILDKK